MGKSLADGSGVETEYQSVYPHAAEIWFRTTFMGFLGGVVVGFALSNSRNQKAATVGIIILGLAGALFGWVIGSVVATKSERKPGDFASFVRKLYVFSLGSNLCWPLATLCTRQNVFNLEILEMFAFMAMALGFQVFPFATAFGSVVLEQRCADATGRVLRTSEALVLTMLFVAVSLAAGVLAFDSLCTLNSYLRTGVMPRTNGQGELWTLVAIATAFLGAIVMAVPRRVPQGGVDSPEPG